jgi:hypothetical protein
LPFFEPGSHHAQRRPGHRIIEPQHDLAIFDLPAFLDDGQSALNLAAARLRHIAGTAWSTKRYLNIELLKDQQMRDAITA